MKLDRLLTVKQLAAMSPAFTEAALRWRIFGAKENGLERALVKVGRRVLIDQAEFENWLEARRVGDVETDDPSPEVG